MPLDEFPDSFIDSYNARFADASAPAMLEAALSDASLGPIALVSAFGADSVVLLHMISQIAPQTPVIFIDTLMLFPETLRYQSELAEQLGLSNVIRVQPSRKAVFKHDNENLLHLHNPDACCALRKRAPLQEALAPFGSWITGRKRYQSASRANLPLFEIEPGANRVKLNPLAGWSRADLEAYFASHNLPRHPLVREGYRSIGCAPCTSQSFTHEDERAGRWRDQGKTECGIHFENGVVHANR